MYRSNPHICHCIIDFLTAPFGCLRLPCTCGACGAGAPSEAPAEASGEVKWEYLDDSGATQGPFTTAEMSGWFAAGYLATDRQVRKAGSTGDYVGLGNIAELAPAPVS
jgi:hypothetical protein